jgi:GTP-binding protein
MFLDEAVIQVRGGDGGPGVVRFRREKYVPFGGPAGGDGGKGGDVVLIVDPTLNTLYRFQNQSIFEARSGQPGGSSNMTGASGEDLIVRVPPGTVVRDLNTGNVMADLTEAGQRDGGRAARQAWQHALQVLYKPGLAWRKGSRARAVS